MGYPQGERPGLRLVYDRRHRPRMDRARARQARQAILDLDLEEETKSACLDAIDEGTVSQSGWRYVLLGIEENLAVVRYLRANARQPTAALELWADLLASMRWDTGEVVDGRAVLAARLGVHPSYISEITALLERVGVVRRERDGRGVRYFINPNVGTHLAGARRDREQAAAGVPQLRLMFGGAGDA